MQFIKDIQQCVAVYRRLPKDSTDIATLVATNRILATCAYQLAEYLGELRMKQAAAEIARRAKFEEVRRREMLNGTSDTGARARAEGESNDEKSAEIIAEAEYQAAKLLYDAAEKVMSALVMQISYLNKERSAEQWGFGSQTT